MGKGIKTIKPLMEKMNASLRLFLLFGFVLLFFSISSCSSHTPEDKTVSKETSEGVDVISVKIRGESISVGETANIVYDRIGTGSLTTATNDPAHPNSFLKLHTYVSEGKTYRISICKTADMEFDHVCRISILKLPQGTDFNTRSKLDQNPDTMAHGHRDRPGDGIDSGSGKSTPKVYTDEDLQKKYGPKK
jgi:hypothetical protein